MILAIFEAISAYLIADLMTGVYHLATDRGWNIGKQVKIFQQHHAQTEAMVMDLRSLFLGVPILIVSIYIGSVFFSFLGIGIILCQLPHYYAHNGRNWLAIILQRCWLILPPEHHQKHHAGDFTKNYCTLSGWNNWWFNYVVSRWDRISDKTELSGRETG